MTSLSIASRPRPSRNRVAAVALSERAVAAPRAKTSSTRLAATHSRKAVIALAEQAVRELSDEIAELEASQSRIGVLRRQRENLTNWILRQAALREAGPPMIGLRDATATAIIVDVQPQTTGGN